MKKIFLLTIICLFTVSANSVLALTYNDILPVNETGEKISDSQKSQAKLLQIYIHRYQEEVNNLYKSYSSESSLVISEANQTLNKMSRVLTRVQNQEILPENVESIVQSIVGDLRNLNTRMKVYLEQQKKVHLETMRIAKSKYLFLGKKISQILDRIVNDLSKSLIKKDSLTQKEKEIVRHLVNIREQNNRIKDFENISFSGEQEIQIYFRNIVQSIRISLVKIKDLSR